MASRHLLLLLCCALLGGGACHAQDESARDARALTRLHILSPSPQADLPPGALARLGSTVMRVRGNIADAALASDGVTVAVASGGRDVTLLDKRRAGVVRVLIGDLQVGPIAQVAFSHDDRFLIGTKPGQSAIVWELRTGRRVWVGAASGLRVIAHPTQAQLIVWRDQQLSVIALDAPESTISAWPDPQPSLMLATPDGAQLVLVGQGELRLIDLVSGQLVRALKHNTSRVIHAAMHPSGDAVSLLSSYGFVSERSLLDPDAPPRLLTLSRSVFALRYDPEGRYIASMGLPGATRSRTLLIPEVVDGLVREWPGRLLHLGPHGALLGHLDALTLVPWGAFTPERLASAPHQEAITSLSLSADDTLWSASRDGRVWRWSLQTRQGAPLVTHRFEPGPLLLASSPDGARVAIAHAEHAKDEVMVLDARTGALQHSVPSLLTREHVAALAMDDAGVPALFTARGRIARGAAGLRVIGDGEPSEDGASAPPASRPPTLLAIGPRGHHALTLTATSPARIALWDLRDGRLLLDRAATRQLLRSTCAIAPDASAFACLANGGDLEVFLVAQERAFAIGVGMSQVGGVVFAPDGAVLLAGSRNQGGAYEPGQNLHALDATHREVHIERVDLQSRRVTHALNTRAPAITALAIHPDGRRLLTGHSDGLIHLWDVAALPEQPALRLPR